MYSIILFIVIIIIVLYTYNDFKKNDIKKKLFCLKFCQKCEKKTYFHNFQTIFGKVKNRPKISKFCV